MISFVEVMYPFIPKYIIVAQQTAIVPNNIFKY